MEPQDDNEYSNWQTGAKICFVFLGAGIVALFLFV